MEMAGGMDAAEQVLNFAKLKRARLAEIAVRSDVCRPFILQAGQLFTTKT